MRYLKCVNQNETVKTIGARLGISHSTVSRALNANRRHLVAPDTRARIEAMARELRYRPSGIARSLRSNTSHSIGFYSAGGYGLEGEFALTLVIGLQNACEQRGYNLLLLSGPLYQRDHTVEETFTTILNSQVDGIIAHATATDPLIERLRQTTLPLMAVSDAPAGVPIVRAADTEGMLLLSRITSGQKATDGLLLSRPI